jgi:hypothetical protein
MIQEEENKKRAEAERKLKEENEAKMKIVVPPIKDPKSIPNALAAPASN